MGLHRHLAACAALFLALSPGYCRAAGPLRAPSGPMSVENPAVRAAANWVPKDLPDVLPSVPLVVPTPPQMEVSAEAPSRSAPPGTSAPDRLAAAGTAAPCVMTLGELEQIALGNNPTIVQAAMRVRAARAKCLQAGLYPNPTIAYQGEEIGDEGKAGFQGARFGQEIVTAGKLKARTATIAREVQQAEHAFQAQRCRVLNDVRSVWYDVLVAQRTVELNGQLVEIGQQGVKAAEDLLEAKEVSRVDVLQARVEADSAKLRLANAQNRYQAAWRRLAAVLGTADLQPTPLADNLAEDLPALNWEDTLTRLLQESPELGEAHAGVQRARCAVAEQCAQRIPNIDLQGGVQYNNSSGYTMAGVGVGIALPIYNRNQGNISKAEAQLIAAEKEVRRLELLLQDRLAGVFEQYANARQEVLKYSAEILPNAKASLDLVRGGYRQGQFDYLTLLTAQRTYFRVNLDYLQSLRQYRLSRVAIEGLLLSGALQKGQTTGEE